MQKYQFGTVEVAGKGETVVVSYQDQILDFLKIAADSSSQLQKAGLETPKSVMDLVKQWDEWNEITPSLLETIMSQGAASYQLNEQDLKWLPPVTDPRKILCIGQNYKDHMEEMGTKNFPVRPYSFMKPITTLVGTGVDVVLPSHIKKGDWEAELGLVIGKKVRNVKGQDALDCIAGYTVINDLSARDWVGEPSLVGTDWTIQKAYDGFLPTGPWLTPAKFVSDPQNLDISLKVNGVIKQNSNTSRMFFSIIQIMEHLSSVMTLEPGDIIATGTPAGVAHGKKDPDGYLKAGDFIEVEIEGLGQLTTKMV